MKMILMLEMVALSLTACSTASRSGQAPPSNISPEAVLITYQVKPGKEEALENVLARAWKIYQREHLVFAKPHVVVRTGETGNKTRLIEVFAWKSGDAPDHAPAAVKAIWEEMQSLCASSDERKGIEGGEVQLVTPRLTR